jgi:hypothetical protein
MPWGTPGAHGGRKGCDTTRNATNSHPRESPGQRAFLVVDPGQGAGPRITLAGLSSR